MHYFSLFIFAETAAMQTCHFWWHSERHYFGIRLMREAVEAESDLNLFSTAFAMHIFAALCSARIIEMKRNVYVHVY